MHCSGDLPGQDDRLVPIVEQLAQRGGVEGAVAYFFQKRPVGVWHDRFDQLGMCPVDGLLHEGVAGGGEIAVVVVDGDHVDAAAIAYPVDEAREGCVRKSKEEQ